MSAVGRQHERPRANTAPSPAKPAVRSDLQVRSVRRQVSTPGLHAIPRSMVSLYLAFVLELSCAISHDIYNLGTNPRAYTETSCLGSAALEHCWGILPLQISGVLALRGGAKTHLRYWRHPDGHRVYTVEKIDPNGRPTLPAHPPPIPLSAPPRALSISSASSFPPCCWELLSLPSYPLPIWTRSSLALSLPLTSSASRFLFPSSPSTLRLFDHSRHLLPATRDSEAAARAH